jgi:hypothetical protein
MRFVLLLVVALGLADPQPLYAQARPSEDALTGKIEFQAGYFDGDDNPITNESLPREVLLQLSFFAGQIAGRVNTPQTVSIPVHIGATTSLDLKDIHMTAEQSAAILNREATKAGLVTTPKETRVARLATVVVNPETKKGVGGAIFRSRATHESLLVVYFDRPCHLTGVVHAQNNEVTYDVSVENAGLHLLKIAKGASTRYRVTASNVPKDISLRILPRSDTSR